MSMKKDEIIESICNMSIIEINELVNTLKKKFNIDNLDNTNDIEYQNKKNEEEKKEFNVILKSVGKNKVSVIKCVRSITNLGLKESKDLVESCPFIIKEKVNKIESENIKKMFEDIGSEIEIH